MHPPRADLGRRRSIRSTLFILALLLGATALGFAVVETTLRVLDPFPYFTNSEINDSEHGNLLKFDATLGWKGLPDGQAELVTGNSRARIEHNRHGFRDVEHDDQDVSKPALVFLGDSFTWGYEVDFDDMFVNRLRPKLPRFEIYNLSHRGYGTDQELLTLRGWSSRRPLRWVLLMFSENDVEDNNSLFRYAKPKPRFERVENELVLTGVPVPSIDSWVASRSSEQVADSWLKRFVFQSHFLHDMHFRLTLLRASPKLKERQTEPGQTDLALTALLLRELSREVSARGARFVVFFIPSKHEIDGLDTASPYQVEIAGLCRRLGIDHVDLAPSFRRTWLRTYFRRDMHWNRYGHRVAADAIHAFLSRDATP